MSTDTKPEVLSDPANSHNNMLTGDYATVNDSEVHLYATFKETDDSPFCTLDEDGTPVLKRSNAFGASPWYNMKIGNLWAKFDSSLQGYREDVTGNVLNNSQLTFPFGDNLAQAAADPAKASKIFKMGLHWALIGDPYNFTLMNRRDRILLNADGTAQALDANSNYQYEKAYLKETEINTTANATVWTLMKNAKKNDANEYFLSESDTRRSRLSSTMPPSGASSSAQAVYPITNAEATKNFYQLNGTKRIDTGNGYAIGSAVTLQSIDTEGVQNDVFDAIVNVYNKMNELVATTGWTELPRNNATWSSELPIDVKRWGCNYHFWADETMTKYPFTDYKQKVDASGNMIPLDDTTTPGEYLIQNGGTVYVNYDYDESIYSSENEYRWVNMFFNWDSTHKIWPKKSRDFEWYTTEDWEYNTEYASDNTKAPYMLRASTQLYRTYDYYDGQNNPTIKYKETKEGWISSPAKDNGNIMKTKAYAYEREQNKEKEQKWALIGDPYRFILYNYNRRNEASTDNAYYLYYNDGAITNKDFLGLSTEERATKQGIYWTWKMDGTNYSYTKLANPSDPDINDEEKTCETTTYVREGLPASSYTDNARLQLQTGYLAVCDMEAKSLYQTSGTLVGAVKAYATFKPETETITVDNSKSATSEKGFNNKYYAYYPPKGTTANGNPTRGAEDEPSYYYQSGNATNDYSLWKQKYGKEGNVWQGPGTAEPESSNTTYKRTQTLEDNADDAQNLVATGGASPDADHLNTGGAARFLVVPMQEKAATVTFHLDPTIYTNGTAISGKSKRNFTTNPICDYTTNNYGVDNTIALPWMMRRQYCDYTYYLVEDPGSDAPEDKTNLIDDLTFETDKSSKTHRLTERSSAYKSFWRDGDNKLTRLEPNAKGEVTIPHNWDGKHVYLRVTYQPTTDFAASTNTGDDDAAKASTVKWMNIVNQEKGNMLQYSRSKGTTGDNTNPGAFATNDYLWAVEGDPYGFVLHNRYAVHGFNNAKANEHWSSVLTTDEVNSDENFNYDDTENNTNFASGKKSGLLYSKVEATASGKMTTSDSDANSIYEAMTGNYDGAMLLHPVAAPVNVQDRNGYKFYSAFLFNATNKWPVQLNYMEDWDVMRNVFANWRLQPQTGDQLLPYYNRAGYVGGLKADVAANAAFMLNDESVNVPALFGRLSAGSATAAEIEQARQIAENPANIVQLEENHFYRIRKFSDVEGGGEYLTGYIHKLELDNQDGTALHTWGKNDTKIASYITQLEGDEGNPWANGLYQNRLSILYPERDQSSVFRFTKNEYGQWKMETQGLVVSNNVMIEQPAEPTGEDKDNMYYEIQDIGLGAMQMRTAANVNSEAHYMSYNPATAKFGLNVDAGELNIANSIHDTKWLIEPVGTTAKNAAGNTYQRPLKIKLTTIGDAQYVTLYLPFNYTLTGSSGQKIIPLAGNIDNLQPVSSGASNNFYHGTFQMQDMPGTIPANTPVLVKATTEQAPDGYAYINLVSEAPTSSAAGPSSLLLRGENLTQVLDESVLGGESDKRVFIFGANNGKAGFYVNAGRDYENKANNLFIPHNSIYFVLTNKQIEDINNGKAITVEIFMEDDEATGVDSAVKSQQGDGIIYDLSGRKVNRITRPGIYIRNGKKIVIK